MTDTRELVLSRVRWCEGLPDLWHVFRDPVALASVVITLADAFRHDQVSAVVGIESRGFMLGGAVAVELGVGFVPVRKAGALFPGPKFEQRSAPDYRGRETDFLMLSDSVGPGDRVLLVDDWVETGSQAGAVRQLVTRCGADLIGLAVLIDGLTESARPALPRVHSVIGFDELLGTNPG